MPESMSTTTENVNVEKFHDIVSKILLIDVDKIADDLNRKDIKQWDSMTHLMLITELEDAFEVAFDEDDIPEIQSIGDLKKTLEKYGVNLS